MPKKISRRKMLAAGAVSPGLLMGAGCTSTTPEQTTEKIQSTETAWWSPGANKDIVRDLTPGTTHIRLACMTRPTMLDYPENESITERVKHIRDMGYTAANANTAYGSRNKWLDASESEIEELKGALEEYDVDFFDTMVWTNLLHPDENTRQSAIKYVCEAFEACERTGCRSVTGITGSRGTGLYTVMHPDNWTGETWKLTIDTFRQIFRDTAGFNTVWAMEACITTNIDTPIAHKRLMEDVGDPRFKICLDPTNMTSLATYYHSTETLNNSFDLLGENIMNGHAKDYILRDQMYVRLEEVPPGQGLQDYETYLVRMSRLSWPRTLLLEHFPTEEYPPAKAFIEKTAEKVGVSIYS
ncbi:sugar phosphate isomerase/epimerase family protein [Candidatus Latescibacterota bacterium]